ncbi:MAG: toxin-antitoxin system YwqK family antitoxin [Flavobacteriaceae bacterium]|nr:toxin-antitoxin system YwqK family antitoxin [Flavobacteriaceae bacterium]
MIKQNVYFIIFLTFLPIFGLSQSAINQMDENGKRHGKWSKNFEGTKEIRYEGQFEHGKEVGVFKFYQLVGKVSKLAATKEFNEKDGSAYVKFLSLKGNVISEGRMMGKTYIGKWVYYHKNSDQIMTEEHFNSKGELHGLRTVYYDNGQKAEVANYENGKLHGDSRYYSQDGVLIKSYIYENDELHGMSKHFDGNGVITVEGPYKRGKKTGIWSYYKNGELQEEKDFTYVAKFKNKNKN